MSYISPAYRVIAVPVERIHANAYNPNHVASEEMRLLYESIRADGYTMPIVCYRIPGTDDFEIVDGFHRYQVMLDHKDIYRREDGKLPVSVIDKPEEERMMSTIRHNRARGEHTASLVAAIVANLAEAGQSDEAIMRGLGMDAEELLRLKQITGLRGLFAGKDFSRAWI